METMENKNSIWKIALIICLTVAVIAAGIWGIGKITRARREEQLARLADAYTSTIPVENEQPSGDPEAAGTVSDSDSVSDADIEVESESDGYNVGYGEGRRVYLEAAAFTEPGHRAVSMVCDNASEDQCAHDQYKHIP